MKIEITFLRTDVERVRNVVTSMADHAIVVERRERNVERRGIDLSHKTIWKRLIGCLLTTRQKSSADSAVGRFIRSTSPLLSLRQCEKAGNVEKLAESELSTFGGIRCTKVIPEQIANNFLQFKTGKWNELDDLLSPLRRAPPTKGNGTCVCNWNCWATEGNWTKTIQELSSMAWPDTV